MVMEKLISDMPFGFGVRGEQVKRKERGGRRVWPVVRQLGMANTVPEDNNSASLSAIKWSIAIIESCAKKKQKPQQAVA